MTEAIRRTYREREDREQWARIEAQLDYLVEREKAREAQEERAARTYQALIEAQARVWGLRE